MTGAQKAAARRVQNALNIARVQVALSIGYSEALAMVICAKTDAITWGQAADQAIENEGGCAVTDRPKVCVLRYENGAYVGCGKCDACHDADAAAIEDGVRDGLMTEAEADLAHAENDKHYSGGVFRYVGPAPAPEARPAIDQPFQQEWEGDQP